MKSLADPGKDKPEKEAKVKPLVDPGAGLPENEAKGVRTKAWKKPAIGDTIRGVRCTKSNVPIECAAEREVRHQGWLEVT